MGKTVPLKPESFKPLALKYRPGRFSDLAGQEAAARVLRNAVQSGRVHSAYLFHGSRGSGKTSTARILARAINCSQRAQDGEPCGECFSCLDIASGRSLDVLEIDAASHTGVDNVREVILDTIHLAPARDPYRIFIIDEVHMLSGSAFNAMLKTLEEPPPNVVFILATTEFAKLPATVVSRTHSFLFRPLGPAIVEERLKDIAAKEKIKIEPKAVSEIARASSGSLRDALSLLQQMTSLAQSEGGTIKGEDVVRLLGLVGEETLRRIIEAMTSRADLAALKELAEECLYRMGYAPGQLLGALHIKCSEMLVESLQGGKESEQSRRLYALERHLAVLLQEIRFTPDPLVACEAGLLGYLLGPAEAPAPQSPPPAQAARPVSVSPRQAAPPAPEPVKPPPAAVPKFEPETLSDAQWRQRLDQFLKAACEGDPLKLYFETCRIRRGDPCVVEFSNPFNLKGAEHHKEKILALWRKFFPGLILAFESGGSVPAVPEPSRPSPESAQEEPSAEVPEDVKQIAELFGGKIKRRRGA